MTSIVAKAYASYGKGYFTYVSGRLKGGGWGKIPQANLFTTAPKPLGTTTYWNAFGTCCRYDSSTNWRFFHIPILESNMAAAVRILVRKTAIF